MEPSNASSMSESLNSAPQLTDYSQLSNFQFLFQIHAKSYNVWQIICGTETRPDADPNEPGISVAERRVRSDAIKNFDDRSKSAMRLLTRAIKSNEDLTSQLANDSTPNLTEDPAIFYSRMCAIALPTSALSVSNVDDVFARLVNDKHEDGNVFFRKWLSMANQAISLGVYKRDNVLKTKFAKALCHNETNLLATLLGSATIDTQSFGEFCNYAILFYNSATTQRSVAEAKNSGKKDTVLVGKFHNFRGRFAGRGRSNNRGDSRHKSSNYRDRSNSSGKFSQRNHNARSTSSSSRGEGGRFNNSDRRNSSSDNSTANVKCFKCNKYGHFANACPENSNISGNKRKSEDDA